MRLCWLAASCWFLLRKCCGVVDTVPNYCGHMVCRIDVDTHCTEILWTYTVPQITQFVKGWESRQTSHLGSSVQYAFQVTNLYQTHIPQCRHVQISLSNFRSIGQEMWAVLVEIHWLLEVKYDYHPADFRESDASSTNFPEEPLKQISWKYDKPFNRWC